MTAIQIQATTVKPQRKISLSLSHDHSHGPLGYLELGDPDAPAVVLLHGFGADLLTWQFCLIPLASRYRILAIDLPGHGRTAADVGAADLGFMTGWLGEALDILAVREAHLVGHSMGGKIALGFALDYPERIASLALVSPAGLGGDFHAEAMDAFLGAANVENACIVAKQLLGPRGRSLGPGLAKSLMDAARDPQRLAAMTRLLGQARAYGLALSPEGFDWSRIRCPVTILWGDHDRLLSLPAAPNLPKVHLIAGAGHLPHMESPAAVVAALKEFLP